MEQDGKLHRPSDQTGERYAATEVNQLNNIGKDILPLTADERKQLTDKVEEVKNCSDNTGKKLMEVVKIAGNVNT